MAAYPERYDDPNASFPMTEFMDGLMSKDRIFKALAETFFMGDINLAKKKAALLPEAEVEAFMQNYMGAKEKRGFRKYQVVIYGASGYTGKLLIEYILQKYPGGFPARWALAGRTLEKVEKARDECFAAWGGAYLASGAEKPECFRADLRNPADLRALAVDADVVVNVAGPFLTSGAELLVEACLAYKTDYVDVNGEVPFTHNLLKYHIWAKRNGVLVVPNAAGAGGQADMTAYWAARAMQAKFGAGTEVASLKAYVTAKGAGAPSGGTLATRAAMSAAVQGGAGVGKIMQDPYALGGRPWDGAPLTPDELDRALTAVEYDRDAKAYKSPFVYAFYETRVVRRSNGLFRELGSAPYGKRFLFQEFLALKTQEDAKALQAAGSNTKAEEEKLKAEGKFKAQGEGAAADERDGSFTQYWVRGRTAAGQEWQGRSVGGDGYEETARLSLETALALANHRRELPFQGGVLTPAAAGGDVLLARLADSGMIFEEYSGGCFDNVDAQEGFRNKLWLLKN